MVSFLNYIGLFVFLVGCHKSACQIPAEELQPRNHLLMQKGIGWPHELHVVVGHEALMKLEGELEHIETCTVRSPTGVEFEVRSPPSNRFEAWSEGCGVRVRNVVASDAGRWRLNATGGGHTLAGWTAVFVENDTTSYTAPEIDMLDGQTNTQIELTSLNNAYCLVTQPFSERSLISGHCRVTLDHATRAIQGNWNVVLGLPGKVQELPFQRRVAVEAERLHTGFERDTVNNKLHLYCNILNTSKNVTFCRFQRTTDAVGFNVVDGLSDGLHSYYGEGFLKRHCGMTIEQPTAQDASTWRCTVGVQQWVDNAIQQQTPLQALISVSPDNSRIARTATERAVISDTVFVQEGQSFTVECRAQVSLAYCWFQHPNGTQYTPTPENLLDPEQPYWYTGELQAGECGITFSRATQEDAGQWTCHMGPENQLGIEATDTILVRVTGPLAANVREISTSIGDSVTLYCHTSNGIKPLDYCRFLTPSGTGFRIDSTVTEDNSILGRYFFTPERDLDYGDCSLTISSVEEEDLGQWTCAALIHGHVAEARDTLLIYVDASTAPLSQAGIIGMSLGLTILIVLLSGVLVYKKGWHTKLRSLPFTSPCRAQPRSTDLMAMDAVWYRSSVRSNNSLESNQSTSGSEVDVTPKFATENKNI